MDTTELLTLLHVLLFCYWLGGDIGVFYASGLVVDAGLRPEARLAAGRIMLACDLVPRICMSLMLTVGGLLSAAVGFAHPAWQMAGIVLLGPFWLGMVLVLHFRHDAAFIPALTRLDFGFRWAMIAVLLASCGWSLYTGRLAQAPWLLAKLLGFALLIFCGLMIRLGLPGFMQGYARLAAGEHNAESDAAMQVSLRRVRPWVITIWLLLVVEAALGIAQPGAAQADMISPAPAPVNRD